MFAFGLQLFNSFRLTQNADTSNQSWHQWFNTNIKSNSNVENLSNNELIDDAAGNGWGECNAFEETQADIDTVVEYGKFDFQVCKDALVGFLFRVFNVFSLCSQNG
jgi:hypothetical protein